MAHLPELVINLALILCAAGVFTVLFKRLRQPQVLGYLIAGFLVGPHFHLFPTVVEEQDIRTWAEIGVIFLMFSLGLEFCFKKLARVGGSAGITAVVEVVGMLLLGYIAGWGLGWSSMDSLFLGGILSISSTTIILRAFDETGVKSRPFASLVFGILIVEDLVAILLLVLLSTIAVEREFKGAALLFSIFRLAFFMILWFLAGIYLLPTFLRLAKPWITNETLLVISVALCMGMVVLSTKAGFSAPLGAFIMGSILAETQDAERIEHLIAPLRDLFGAVFFISVGMLIDPSVIVHYLVPILIITAITLTGKFLTSAVGALASGQSLHISVLTGLSLAQIGEFSFIISTLGMDLHVTSTFLYPIAVAVSAITTFTTPYLIKGGEGLYAGITKRLPRAWTERINRYGAETKALPATPAWKRFIRHYIFHVVSNVVILFAILILTTRFLDPAIRKNAQVSPILNDVLISAITLVLMSPFLWGLAFRKLPRLEFTGSGAEAQRQFRGPVIMLDLSRLLCAAGILEALLETYFPTSVALIGAGVCCAGIYFLFSKRLQTVYHKMEGRFLENLGAREGIETERDLPHP